MCIPLQPSPVMPVLLVVAAFVIFYVTMKFLSLILSVIAVVVMVMVNVDLYSASSQKSLMH